MVKIDGNSLHFDINQPLSLVPLSVGTPVRDQESLQIRTKAVAAGFFVGAVMGALVGTVVGSLLIQAMMQIRMDKGMPMPSRHQQIAIIALTIHSGTVAFGCGTALTAALLWDDDVWNADDSPSKVSQDGESSTESTPFINLELTNGSIALDQKAVLSFGQWFVQESIYESFFYDEVKATFPQQFLSDVLEAAEDRVKGEAMGIRFEKNGEVVVAMSSYAFHLASHQVMQSKVLGMNFSNVEHRQNCFDVR